MESPFPTPGARVSTHRWSSSAALGTVFCIPRRTNELVRLFFLLVTPAEHPETQLALLKQLARLARTQSARDMLIDADTRAELLGVIHRLSVSAQPAANKPGKYA